MIELRRHGRWVQFTSPIDSRLEKVISKTLSYEKPGKYFMGNPAWAIVYMYNMKKHAFPSGLLSLVRPILDSWCTQYKDTYMVEHTEGLKQHPVQLTELRPYQKAAFQAFWDNKGGLLNISVAGGKTMVGERILASCGPENNKLIVVPTRELQKHWNDEMYSMINVHKITGYKCDIKTYQKLYRDIKKDKDCLKKYDIVIFDEAHKVAASTFYKVGMSCQNAMICALTGTPRRSDRADMKIMAVTGPIIYTAQIEELTKDKYLTPVKIHIIDIPRVQIKPDMDYSMIYNSAIINNKDRNEKIVNIAIEKSKEGMVLILFDRIEHGQKLYGELERLGKMSIFIHGTTKNRDIIYNAIKAYKYDVVLASRIFNEGINLPKLKTLIIASGGKSAIKLVQQIGRVIRLSENKDVADVYDFADGCKILKGHLNERKRIYQENGFEIIQQ